jgi:predicted Abi (CAAX) family protease
MAVLISSVYSQDLSKVVKNEFGDTIEIRYVEFRTVLNGQPTASRASESAWQELRKDLEQGWEGSKKPVIRIIKFEQT